MSLFVKVKLYINTFNIKQYLINLYIFPGSKGFSNAPLSSNLCTYCHLLHPSIDKIELGKILYKIYNEGWIKEKNRHVRFLVLDYENMGTRSEEVNPIFCNVENNLVPAKHSTYLQYQILFSVV